MNERIFNLTTASDWSAFLDWLLPFQGQSRLLVKVSKYRKKRSLQANAYYWSVVIPALAAHFGYTPDEMHTVLLGTYTGWEQYKFRNQTLYRPRRTSTTPNTMDTVDFQGLVMTGQQIAAEEGVILPDQEAA